MRKLVIIVLALLAPFLLVLPAHADEPAPDPNPELTACQKREQAALGEADYQRGQASMFEELYDSYRAAHELQAGIAHDWQMRALAQGQVIARQRATIARLRAQLANR